MGGVARESGGKAEGQRLATARTAGRGHNVRKVARGSSARERCSARFTSFLLGCQPMFRRSLLIVAAFALCAASCWGGARKGTSAERSPRPPSSAARVFPSEAELRALVEKRVEQKLATGIVLGVRDGDGTHTIVACGDPGPGALPLGPKSVFEIGSITKVFTGILLADMAARGEVGLEDTVQSHAHPGVTIPSHGTTPIRLVDLSTHTSGLPRLPSNFYPADPSNPYADYSVDQLHQFLSGYTLPRDVGAKYEYSNLGTGLLGHILASIHGSDWESLAKARILVPLGMTMTGVTLTAEMKRHLVRGHDAEGKVVANWDLPTLVGAGGLRSDAEDMLRFVDANLAPPTTPLQAAMQASHAPLVDAGPEMKVGLNWHIRSTPTHTIVWHNGGTGGYMSFVGFDVERKVGVVVLENSTHGPEDIGFHLLDDSLPLAEPPREHHEIEVAPELAAEYVGVYQLSPAFHLNVVLRDGKLAVQATGQPEFPIFAETETEFFYKVVDAQLTFVRGASGKVDRLILHQNGADVPAVRLEGEAARAAIASMMGKERREIEVAPEILEQYVGVYALSPTFSIEVKLRDGKLVTQATGQDEVPIFAETETDFFARVVDAQLTFVRGESGDVTEMVLHQGGMDHRAKKVK